MILYLDTSALIKLYVREPGSAQVRGWWKRASAAACSVVAYAEARATLARLHRQAPASGRRHRERVAALNAAWQSFVRIEVTETILRLAAEAVEVNELRGFDSIHLASALWLREQTDEPCAFAAFDRRLWEGAVRAGLSVLPARLSAIARAAS